MTGSIVFLSCSERIEIATSKLSVNTLEAIGISHVGYAKGTTRNHPKTYLSSRHSGGFSLSTRRLNHCFDQSRSARLHSGGEKIGEPLRCFCSRGFDAHTLGELDPI